MKSVVNFFLVLQSVLLFGNAARILCIYPMPSISHQVVFRPLTLELVKRGHDLVVLTANPIYTNETNPYKNLKEIDIGLAYNKLKDMVRLKVSKVTGAESVIQNAAEKFMEMLIDQLSIPEVKELLEEKNQSFDLIFIEPFYSYLLILSETFKAPVILFSSFYALPHNFDTVGAVARHPLYYPIYLKNDYEIDTFFQRLKAFVFETIISYEVNKFAKNEDIMLKKHYGPNAPTVKKLNENVAMLFINVNPMFDNHRPVPSNVLYLGALHLQPVKEISDSDLKTYLDNSKLDIVYASFGTNVRVTDMDQEIIEDILAAFESLPYNILWKCDMENLTNVPQNVRVQKWFPQRDLLFHPKIKAFVTQGGLQSTDEAIDAAVPVIGIPMLGDQYYTVQKYVEFGIGVKFDVRSLTAEGFAAAIRNVVEDPGYKKNITRLREIMRDQPMNGLQRAIWWTEYVLRHSGASHLRTPAANVSWSEYYMLDVVSFLIIVTLAIIFVILKIVLLCLRGLKWVISSKKVKIS